MMKYGNLSSAETLVVSLYFPSHLGIRLFGKYMIYIFTLLCLILLLIKAVQQLYFENIFKHSFVTQKVSFKCSCVC